MRGDNFLTAQRRADHSGGANEKLRRVRPQLAGELRCGGDGRGIAVRAGAAIGVAGIHDQAAHALAGFRRCSLRGDHGRGDNPIGGEDGGSHGRGLADEYGRDRGRDLFNPQ